MVEQPSDLASNVKILLQFLAAVGAEKTRSTPRLLPGQLVFGCFFAVVLSRL
jgi:hypothetical protein